jgi:hypothetical protein
LIGRWGARREGSPAADVYRSASVRCAGHGGINALAARRLCRQFGITLKPIQERCGEMESHCISIIPHLMKKHGTEAMVLTLRVLTETNPHNRHQLNREVITAVNAVCRSKRWTALGLSFLEAWDAIDLGELRQRAISFGLWMQPVWVTMVALIIDRLRPVLEPLVPKPTTKPVKIPRNPSRRFR